MSASDFPNGRQGFMHSALPLGANPPKGTSQVPRPLFLRASPPTTPDRPFPAHARCFKKGLRLHHMWKASHGRSINEAESSSLALQLADLLTRASYGNITAPQAEIAT